MKGLDRLRTPNPTPIEALRPLFSLSLRFEAGVLRVARSGVLILWTQ
jgi:hypothetical protein